MGVVSPRHGKEDPGLERLRVQLAEMTAERDQLQQHLDARAELDQMLMAAAAAPAADGTGPIARVQGPRATSHRVPREQRWLRVVPGFALAALGGLRWAWHAHRVATIAATALTVATATSAAVVAAPHGPIAQAFGATPVASAPADGLYSASPITGTSPSSLRLIGSVSRPALDARSSGSHLPVTAVPVPPSCCYQPPASPQPSQQQAPASPSTPAATPATLQVSTTAVDLTSGLPATITLSATGSGWVSWRIGTFDPQIQAARTDLDFSPSHGVLQGGQSVTVTITLDSTQDGAVAETFSIAGQQVTAALPVPVPAASPADVAPSAGATDIPSPAAS